MQNLIFKRLTVASDTQSAANQFEFHPKYNLITANDNSLGKSTVAKLLQWALGAEPNFDTTWQSFDARVLVEFEIGAKKYKIGRAGDSIYLKKDDQDWAIFPKITGDYSAEFSNIVGFHALLPNRNDPTLLENPPPAYYLLPYYIDQKRGWNQPWTGFVNLEQYSNWYKTIIKYHTGYLNQEHFLLEEEKAKNNFEKKLPEKENKSIKEALEFVEKYNPSSENIVKLSESEFNELAEQINTDIFNLQQEQEKILGEISEVSAEKSFQKNQQKIIQKSIADLDEDYIFAVENFDNGVITCPICGTDHKNTAPNRALILADHQEALNQNAKIEEIIKKLDGKLAKRHEKLKLNKENIEALQKKYQINIEANNDPDYGMMGLIESIASRSIQTKAGKTVSENLLKIDGLNKKNKEIKDEQKTLISKEDLEEKDEYFKNTLREYIDKLKANKVNLSEIDSPLAHKKLVDNGGAAESTRGILAYYMTILQQIKREKNEVFSCIIIDTPNQQEQTDFNYELILDFIINNKPSDAQIIVCAMDKPEIKKYKALSKVTEITDEKILLKSKFKELRPLLNFS